MTNRFRVSGTLSKRLKELRVSPDAVLRQLPLGLFQQIKIFLTRGDVRTVRCDREDQRPSWHRSKLGSDERPEHYGPIAIAALYTRSFRDAMDRIARYKSGRRRPERCDLRGRRPEPQRRDRRGVPYQVPPLRSNIREAAGET